ncbi:hypothetical protein Y032_0070g471 [Ancylostoma ceylanicum]|uniref:Uncharacterized protein n=1 Tax=Ancylostoma ceylanicum TaxID=53326 RepID=A0A016TXH9_9BILA|nr:hypothetical protein Y032_0070g471 [Ancylostoma ceylanicum]
MLQLRGLSDHRRYKAMMRIQTSIDASPRPLYRLQVLPPRLPSAETESKARFTLQVSSIVAFLQLSNIKSWHSSEPSGISFLELDCPAATVTARFK